MGFDAYDVNAFYSLFLSVSLGTVISECVGILLQVTCFLMFILVGFLNAEMGSSLTSDCGPVKCLNWWFFDYY